MGEKLTRARDKEFMHNTRKPEGKRPQMRSRRRWVDNIKIYVKEMGLIM
jgi:hypothetical protein